MPKNRFYYPDALLIGAEVKLPEFAANHAVRVLRMSEGGVAILFNGDGLDYICELTLVKKSEVLLVVKASQKVAHESPLKITLLQGISSGDRMDYTIQKAVELGVCNIQPVSTERSVVKLNQARAEKRLEHWQSVVNSACEQSGRAFVPKVAMPMPLNQWLVNNPQNQACRILLNPVGAKRLADLARPDHKIQLLIGAEGGLSHGEIEAATSHGFQSVILGPRILRTETAALTAIASMQTLWGDF